MGEIEEDGAMTAAGVEVGSVEGDEGEVGEGEESGEGGGLTGFAITRESLREITEWNRRGKAERDGRVCVCGHPVTRHSEWAGRTACAPTRMLCPCAVMVPVIDVTDTRPFLRKTHGEGAQHALLQGLYGLIEKGREWSWLTGFPICMRCEREGVAVMPFSLAENRRPSREPEKVNVLLCEDCAPQVAREGM